MKINERGKMKNLCLALFCIMVAAYVSGCASSRGLAYPYEQVADAAKEKFYLNTWTEFSTTKSLKIEKPGKDLKIIYYEWLFPDTKIYCNLEVYAEKGGGTTVYVYVKDYDAWYSPLMHSWATAGKVLDVFEKRMSSGAWDPLPWAEGLEEKKIK
ncbi:MAG: hypothetical protein NT118_15820 [Lentisphaerae bacterium]|nr:hypothetical protein [Lentisphaerota bacterium]